MNDDFLKKVGKGRLHKSWFFFDGHTEWEHGPTLLLPCEILRGLVHNHR